MDLCMFFHQVRVLKNPLLKFHLNDFEILFCVRGPLMLNADMFTSMNGVVN